jgi:nucleotide-binding universal stress UspA family protein
MNDVADRGPVLVCYDGSDHARAAIEASARFLQGREALVVCFWTPFVYIARRYAVSLLELVQDPETVNAREEALAEAIAGEGAQLAVELGLRASPQAVRIEERLDRAILDVADQIDTPLIVVGARGRSNLGSLFLGDVADEVVQRATRPVFVAPSSGLAGRRREELRLEGVKAKPV